MCIQTLAMYHRMKVKSSARDKTHISSVLLNRVSLQLTQLSTLLTAWAESCDRVSALESETVPGPVRTPVLAYISIDRNLRIPRSVQGGFNMA